MTPKERVAQLEAELSRERASRERMERALEDAMASVRAAADDRKALEARRAADRERRRRADEEKRRQALEHVSSRDVPTPSSRESHVSPPPSSPPFPSPFPPSPDPSSPYPLSFPPSSPTPVSSPPSSADPREELRLEPLQAARRAAPRKAKAAPEKPTDPRHAPLVQQLVAAGWAHHGGRTAKAVSELLVLANQHCLAHGGDVPGEVKRRAAIAKAHEGFPRVRELHELVPNWGHFERQPLSSRGPAPPSDFSTPTPYVQPAWLDPEFGKE